MLWASPLAGGAQRLIATLTSPYVVVIQGKAVLLWNSLSTTSPYVGALTVWTAVAGSNVASMTSVAGIAAVSPDSTRIMFSTNAAGSSVTIAGANIDLTGQVPLVTSVNNSPATCAPNIGWSGIGASASPIVAYCPGATTVATISRFTGAAWVKADIMTNSFAPPWWSADAAGTKILAAVTGTSNAIVVPITGGAQTQIDTSVFLGFLTDDGLAAIYATNAQTIKRSQTLAPSPVALGPTGIIGVSSKSPDKSKWLYYTRSNAMTGFTDLLMTTTTSPGVQTSLSIATSAAVYGDTFTADSSRALFLANVNVTTGVGTLQSCASGGTPATLGANVWIPYALTGAVVAFNDNTVNNPTDINLSRADIRTADVSMAPAPIPKLLVQQANVNFFPSSDRSKIVYTYDVAPTVAGLYVAAPPP